MDLSGRFFCNSYLNSDFLLSRQTFRYFLSKVLYILMNVYKDSLKQASKDLPNSFKKSSKDFFRNSSKYSPREVSQDSHIKCSKKFFINYFRGSIRFFYGFLQELLQGLRQPFPLDIPPHHILDLGRLLRFVPGIPPEFI